MDREQARVVTEVIWRRVSLREELRKKLYMIRGRKVFRKVIEMSNKCT